jgi:hypothetical protein
MSRKLIFISSLPISRLFGEKLDARWFAQNGFDVQFWDASGLFFPAERREQYFSGAENFRFIGPGHRIFADARELGAALQSLPPDVVIWHLSRFNKSVPDDWIFSELQKRGVPYYLQHFDTVIEPAELARRTRHWLAQRKQRFLNRDLLPQGVVGSGRLGRKQSLAMFPASRFVSIPSVKVLWRDAGPVLDHPYNVFVDENVDYGPDAKLLGYSVCRDADAYYERLNRLFDEIEEWSGHPVVVSASGKFRYERDRFNGRRLIYGQTLPLIQHAQFVMGHMSLALDQSLVSHKPVLTIDDPDFTEVKRRDFAVSLLYRLRKPVLVTDVVRSVYLQAMSPQTEVQDELVCDYLKEEGVSADYHSIMQRELSEQGSFGAQFSSWRGKAGRGRSRDDN